jgi:Fe-S cluster assembly iron-binding protein IscA
LTGAGDQRAAGKTGTSNMIIVTESAREVLKRTLLPIGQPEAVLRLIANKARQLALVVDCKSENDQLIKYQEGTVLVIDKEISAAFDGVGIDYQGAAGGLRLFKMGSKSIVSNW